jgi:hypothetical protein
VIIQLEEKNKYTLNRIKKREGWRVGDLFLTLGSPFNK